MRLIERCADAAADDRIDDHLHDRVDADEQADKDQCADEGLLLTFGLEKSLDVIGISEEQNQCAHEENRIEQCCQETGDKARSRAADFLGKSLVDQSDEEAVERTGYKYVVCRTFEEFQEAVTSYIPPPGRAC